MRLTGTYGCSGLTWVEVLVALFVIVVLAMLALPAITSSSHGGGQMMQALSNMKQLHLATQSAALDGPAIGDLSLGWPGDTGGTFTNWVGQLVPSYLGTNDFCKLLSGPGKQVRAIPSSMSEGAILVYAVRDKSSTNAVFLTTANFTNTPAGGVPLSSSAKPFGDKGFVVFRKDTYGSILMKNQVANTNLIGSYEPLLK